MDHSDVIWCNSPTCSFIIYLHYFHFRKKRQSNIQEKSLLKKKPTLVMTSSWNFSSWAELSQAERVPSQVKPSWGISIFKLKPSWIFFMYSFSSSKYILFCFYQFLNQKISHVRKKKHYLLQSNLKIEKFSKNARKVKKTSPKGFWAM